MALQNVKQLHIDLANKALLVTARVSVHGTSVEMRVSNLNHHTNLTHYINGKRTLLTKYCSGLPCPTSDTSIYRIVLLLSVSHISSPSLVLLLFLSPLLIARNLVACYIHWR